ncbi:MAG: phosphoribosylanthranilate isomerase [Saprospiraceae bacterium]|nr:phosphoribosylanthranilate isomerase [Saprospiraceae bacterium]
MLLPKVKICCISSPQEAQTAIRAGASALGLVAEMPSGPGVISDDTIRAIARSVPPPIATFLLTSRTDTALIAAHQQATGANTVQIVDALTSGSYAELRAALPGIALVQVIHVVDEASLDEALAIAPRVDALLLDSGNPKLAVKELGGTGRVHNWAISRQIVEQADVPVFLAGGLRPDNVRAAVDAVQPWGLDLCSGVRTEGRLDEQKLTAFFEALARV